MLSHEPICGPNRCDVSGPAGIGSAPIQNPGSGRCSLRIEEIRAGASPHPLGVTQLMAINLPETNLSRWDDPQTPRAPTNKFQLPRDVGTINAIVGLHCSPESAEEYCFIRIHEGLFGDSFVVGEQDADASNPPDITGSTTSRFDCAFLDVYYHDDIAPGYCRLENHVFSNKKRGGQGPPGC